MLKFADVYGLRLGRLQDAAADWGAMAARLERLAGDSRTSLVTRARAADWRGVNAAVTQPFLAKTAKEFADAAAAARGVHTLLVDGHDAFRHAQRALRAIVSTEAPARRLVVDPDTGRVRPADPLRGHPEAHREPDYAALVRREDAAVAALQARIAAVLESCDEADRSLARALRADATDQPHGFSPARFGSLDAEEAHQALLLARKGPALTTAELAALDELLADNHASPEFTTRFYEGLGPRGALEFYGRMARDAYSYGEPDPARLDAARDLQRYLGLSLATATDPDHRVHLGAEYAAELRRLGTERIPLGRYDPSPPYGYQLLGGILRHGDYDRRFLVPVAEDVVRIHAADPHFFGGSRPPLGGRARHLLNPSGQGGSGYDPVVSVLEALGHSPEAARAFFDPENPPVELGTDADGRPLTSYLDYFARAEVPGLPDTESADPEEREHARAHLPDALGHALEAATLGHAWDAPNPVLHRTEQGAGIMREVVVKWGGDPALLRAQEPLADSLGRMAAGHTDDLARAVANRAGEGVFGPTPQEREGRVKLERDQVRDFLTALGQHPDAYASVTTANRVYGASVMETHGFHDGRIDEGRARIAIRTTAEVQGLLDESRANQVRADGEAKHEDYEKAQERRSQWIEFGTAAVVGAGVACLPVTAAAAGAGAVLVPLAADVGGGAVEEAASAVLGGWTDQAVEDHKSRTESDTHVSTKRVYQAGEMSAEAPMNEFMRRHGVDGASTFGNDLIESMRGGYQVGNSRATQQGHEPEDPK
ncbi:hypothetical protein [Streptomyces sp. NPDC097619]|uniref:hypothetical protein n=1 Tax=Streptomyces sp. NPDC097619 TaxID=3157228 RepID=UPI00332F365C